MSLESIYVLKDPRSEEIRYVGKTTNLRVRFNSHLAVARIGRPERVNHIDSHCARWIRCLLRDEIRPKMEVIETTEHASERERFWIKHFRMHGARLTNHTDGGEGQPGLRQSEITRHRHSVARIRFFNENPSARRALSEALMGHVVSDVTRRKQSEKAKLRKPSKMSNLRRKISCLAWTLRQRKCGPKTKCAGCERVFRKIQENHRYHSHACKSTAGTRRFRSKQAYGRTT